MLGTAAGRLDEVGPVELGARHRQGRSDAGQAVRPVGHLHVAALGPHLHGVARRQEGPVRPGVGRLGLGQQDVRSPVRQLLSARSALPSGPDRAEQVAGGAEGDVVDPGVRGEPRWRHPRLLPAVVRGELGEPGDRLRRPVGLQRGQDAEVADQSVEVGVRRRRRQPCSDPRRDAVRQRAAPRRSTAGPRGPRPARARARRPRCASRPGPPAVRRRAAPDSGIHGPSSSHRTWSSTQRQAASPRSAYVSEVVTPDHAKSPASTRGPTGRPWSS